MILSPLDCFWEGSKPLGPFPPNDEILGFNVAWKKLNPQSMVNTLNQFRQFFESDEIDATKDLFARVMLNTVVIEHSYDLITFNRLVLEVVTKTDLA